MDTWTATGAARLYQFPGTSSGRPLLTVHGYLRAEFIRLAGGEVGPGSDLASAEPASLSVEALRCPGDNQDQLDGMPIANTQIADAVL